MLDQYGALESAHHLLQSVQPQEGLFILWEKKLMHLSIEALVLDPRFQPLFSSEELDRARQRLEDLGYSVAD
jgi:AMMECR1 domain-containing protein